MTQEVVYFSRAGRAGADDVLVRIPELRALREKTVAQFGAGCIGAPSALEFARAGVGELRILDHDIVDPGTISRWPLGLSAAGKRKVDMLAAFIKSNYPSTKVVPYAHLLGAPPNAEPEAKRDPDIIDTMLAAASIIYDATAEIGVQQYLSVVARERGIPYICVSGTFGGWGGKIIRIVPGRTDCCWMCCWYAACDASVPEPPVDPHGEVQPRGCGDVTFTGAGFDMGQVALAAVRGAVSVLCQDSEGGYPLSDWDVTVISFRNHAGQLIAPKFEQFTLPRHPQCPLCGNQ